MMFLDIIKRVRAARKCGAGTIKKQRGMTCPQLRQNPLDNPAELLGITADEVRALRDAEGMSIMSAKAQLIRQRLQQLAERIEDPTVKIILSVLITQYR